MGLWRALVVFFILHNVLEMPNITISLKIHYFQIHSDWVNLGAIAEYPASLFPVGGILWRTSQNTIEVILMQINGPGILQFSLNLLICNSRSTIYTIAWALPFHQLSLNMIYTEWKWKRKRVFSWIAN